MSHILNTIQSSINIYLDSENVYSHDDLTGSYKFIFKEPVEALPNHQMLLEIKSSIFSMSMYSINALNNTLIVDGISYLIPVGNYDAASLIVFLDATIPGIVTTFNSTNMKFSFTKTSGSGSQITFNSCTALQILGFSSKDHQTSNYTLESEDVVDLSGIKQIVVKVPNLNLGSRDSKGQSVGILAKIPCFVNPGEIIYWSADTSVKHQIKTRLLDHLTIDIRDEFNNNIDFNGTPWYMELIIHFIEERDYRQKVTHYDDIKTDLDEHHRQIHQIHQIHQHAKNHKKHNTNKIS